MQNNEVVYEAPSVHAYHPLRGDDWSACGHDIAEWRKLPEMDEERNKHSFIMAYYPSITNIWYLRYYAETDAFLQLTCADCKLALLFKSNYPEGSESAAIPPVTYKRSA